MGRYGCRYGLGSKDEPMPKGISWGGQGWEGMGEGIGWGARVSPCPKVVAWEGKDGKEWVKVWAGGQG